MQERIDTLYGNDDILKTTLWLFDSTHKTMEGCIGKDEVAIHVTHELIWNGLLKLKRKEVQLRVITQITNDNLTYCKTLSEIVDVRHVDGIQSSFGICDGKCGLTIKPSNTSFRLLASQLYRTKSMTMSLGLLLISHTRIILFIY